MELEVPYNGQISKPGDDLIAILDSADASEAGDLAAGSHNSENTGWMSSCLGKCRGRKKYEVSGHKTRELEIWKVVNVPALPPILFPNLFPILFPILFCRSTKKRRPATKRRS